MASSPDIGMEKAELRSMLTAAKGGPVNCAIGLGKDNSGLIMMHKTKGAKAVEKELSTKFGDMKMSRWGTVQITDDGIARFTINKTISGMAKRLSKSLKGTGCRKIEIVLEDGTVVEGASDEEDEGGAEGTTSETEASSTAQSGPDLAELEKELRELVAGIAKADPEKAAALKASATMAATALKAKDGETAASALARMKETLDGGSGETAAIEPASFVTMQKSRLLWDSARKKVAGEIGALKDKVMEEFEGDAEQDQVLDALDQLDEITSTLDERLMDALDDALNEQDPAKHAELVKEARSILGEYASYVSSNTLIQGLSGDTPFGMKLTIGPTYAAVIKALQSNLR